MRLVRARYQGALRDADGGRHPRTRRRVAEYVALPAGNLHDTGEHGDRTAVFIEPVAAACRICEQVPLSRNARVAVVGDGRMGLIVAQVVRIVAADVTVFGKHESKLAIARGLGLETGVSNAAGRDAMFDVAVDVTGRLEARCARSSWSSRWHGRSGRRFTARPR